jgi:hypothetical protein
LTNPQSEGETVSTESQNLTDGEKKMAYVMGYDVDNPTLIEKLIMRWNLFRAMRHIQANKIPLRVIIRNMAEQEEVKS